MSQSDALRQIPHRRRPRLIVCLSALGLALLLLGCSRGAASLTATEIAPPEAVVSLPSPAAPTATAEMTPPLDPSPIPTDTPSLTATRPLTHVVASGEVLGAIALQYNVSVEALSAANNLDDPHMIKVGQILTIPGTAEQPAADDQPVTAATPLADLTTQTAPAVTVTATLIAPPPTGDPTPTAWTWTPSILEGNLTAAYAGSRETDRFTIHYTPGTHPEADLENVTHMLHTSLAHLETLYETGLAGRFDVYVAGALYASPSQALRGRSFSAARRIHFLHDGTGNQADQQYIAAHEMTHLFSWNAFGRPVSAMLSEGAAVYAGMQLIADADHLPIDSFCAVYQRAGVLPRVSSTLAYSGHIRDLPNYYAAGCFVSYLVETYGPEPFRRLYPTGDYGGIYGKSLSALEEDWRADLAAGGHAPSLDAAALVAAGDRVSVAYDRLLPGFSGTPPQYAAYLELDKARIALLEGRIDAVHAHLEAMAQTLQGP